MHNSVLKLTQANDPKRLLLFPMSLLVYIQCANLPQTEICMKNDYARQSRLAFWPGLLLIKHNRELMTFADGRIPHREGLRRKLVDTPRTRSISLLFYL